MTQVTSETWLWEEDERFAQQGQKVVFIGLNFPACGKVDGLQ